MGLEPMAGSTWHNVGIHLRWDANPSQGACTCTPSNLEMPVNLIMHGDHGDCTHRAVVVLETFNSNFED